MKIEKSLDIRDKMTKNKTLIELGESHTKGSMIIEQSIKSRLLCDFGIQISVDGRVWICVDGIAFVRFKPEMHGQEIFKNLTVYGGN